MEVNDIQQLKLKNHSHRLLEFTFFHHLYRTSNRNRKVIPLAALRKSGRKEIVPPGFKFSIE